MLVRDNDCFTTPETTQRFDLIRHLIENSEIVPLVRGPLGIGKSLLATRIQQEAPDNWSVCLIEASASLAPEQLLATIARLLGWSDLQDDLLQGLVKRFEVMREKGQIPVVLIDEAHLLQPTGLITLLRLFERQRVGEPLVSIVLFADEQIDMLLSTPQLRIMSPQSIQVIDLQPLSREEATSYMRFLLQVEGLSTDLELDSSRMNRLYRETQGIPGPLRQEILNAIGNRGRDTPSVLRGSQRALYLVIPLVIVTVGILLFQDRINELFTKPSVSVESGPTTQQSPRFIIKKPSHTTETSDGASDLPLPLSYATEEENLIGLVDAGIDDASESLPQETPAVPDKAPEVFIAEVPTAPAEPTEDAGGVADDGSLAAGQQFLSKNQELDVEEPSLPGPEMEPDKVILPDVESVETKVNEPKVRDVGPLLAQAVKAQHPLRRDAWVKARPPKHYTLQLLGVENLESLENFVTRHGLKGEIFFIETRRKGRPWYSLMWGDFPDKSTAMGAIQGLPPKVKRNGIWARSFGELHKLLDY